MAFNFPYCPAFWRNYELCSNWARNYDGCEFYSQNATYGWDEVHTPPTTTLDDGAFYETPEEGEAEISEDSFEFVVDDRMMEFLEQSIRHREALRKEKNEKFSVPAECENRRRQYRASSESKEMVRDEDISSKKLKLDVDVVQNSQLYGKKVCRIAGMETAVELNFLRVVSSCQPVLWPVIELNM